MLCFDFITYYFNRGNEKVDIRYNINYIKVLELLKKDSSPQVNQEKIYFICSQIVLTKKCNNPTLYDYSQPNKIRSLGNKSIDNSRSI